MTDILVVEHLSCGYQQRAVVENVSFSLGQGNIACLLGPSGCGKTTVLRTLAGFNPVLQGRVSLNQRLLSAPDHFVAPEQRRIGMVFQDYALFPHLNVMDNIAFGLRGWPKAKQSAKVQSLLELVHLQGLGQRYPHELSGGQQQRVALARALAPEPELLLMDEPFSNLDTDLRRHLAREVRDILKQQSISAVLVTHDQEEAFAFSDYVGVLADGGLQQWDTPYNLYYHPANPRVAAFVGKGEFIPGRVEQGMVHTEIGPVPLNGAAVAHEDGQQVQLFIRPNEIVPGQQGQVEAQVLKKEFLGTVTLYTLGLENGRQLSAALDSHIDLHEGARVRVCLRPPHAVTFAA
ncbi:ABC transporter ATP-binding protein [Balneatrix alpica]|uniref:ABC transporter ATP-binding protein n=1 Tax=Balneatrix alpica TaxID=75684 RepID=UPI00273A0FC4|nr:ABC transporter ATP-binding protein [Balneatrix alpica]